MYSQPLNQSEAQEFERLASIRQLRATKRELREQISVSLGPPVEGDLAQVSGARLTI